MSSLISIPEITLTTATAGTTIDIGEFVPSACHISVQTLFSYGSGGTTAKFYLQTSLDDGTTWADIGSFAHTTSTLTCVAGIRTCDTSTAITVLTDGALTDNTLLAGVIGTKLRLKYVTTGTYAGGTTFKMDLTIQ